MTGTNGTYTPTAAGNLAQRVVIPDGVTTAKENNTSGSTTDGTWIVLPENISFVAIQVDAQGATVKANVEYTKDRAGAVANSVTCFENWNAGEINNKVQGAEFADIAGIRLNPVVSAGGLPKMYYTAG